MNLSMQKAKKQRRISKKFVKKSKDRNELCESTKEDFKSLSIDEIESKEDVWHSEFWNRQNMIPTQDTEENMYLKGRQQRETCKFVF